MGKLIGKVNTKNNSSSGKVIGHIAPQSLEKLLLREQEEALQEAQQNAVKTASRYQAMTVHEKRLLEEEEKLRKKQVPTEHEIVLASAKSKKKSGETLTVKENIALEKEKGNLNLDTQTLKALSDQADKDYNTAKINEFKGADSSASYSALSRKNTLNTAYKNSLMTDIIKTATESVDFNTKSVADKNVADNDYKYINDINGFRNGSKSAYDEATAFHANSADTAATAAAVKFVSQSTKPSYMDSNYQYMTEEEIKIYNYYFNKGQKSRAKEYLSMLKETLQQRANGEIVESMTEFSKTSKLGASILSVATNVGSSLQQGINMIKYLGTGETETNDYALMTSSLRKGVTDQVDWTINNWDAFDFIYNTSMSGVDSLVMAPAGSAGAVMLGLSAAASTSNDVLERGGTSSQAFWSGLMAGAAEAVFEKISIGQLDVMKDTTIESVLDVVKNYGKAMLTNASEEALTEIANIGTDYLINGGISQYSLLISEYIANGETTASAKRKASQQMVNQVLEAGASGAFMGLGFATLGTGISYTRDAAVYNAAGKAIVANGQENFMIQKALELNPKSVAYKLASEIQSSGKLNNQKLGKLSFEIKSEINNAINEKITAAVNTQIEAADISANEKQELSIAFKKAISGEALSTLENKILSNNEVASKISSDLTSRTAPWVKYLVTQLEQNRNDLNLINSAMNLSLEKLAENLPDADSNAASPVSVNENSNLTQEQKNLNAVLSAATSGMKRSYPLNTTKNSDIIEESSNGGTDNGREGLLRDGSQRFGGEEQNSQIQVGGVSQDYGRIPGITQESAGRNRIEPDLRNQGNNRGLTPSEEQSLEGTVVTNDDGTPKAVYHFTENMDFDTFGEGDIGFHFGSQAQSLKRASDLKQTGRTIKAFLAIKNPIRIPMDIMSWQAAHVALKLQSEDYITEEQYNAIHDLQVKSGGTYNTPAAQELRRILNDKGYDGIVYDNHHEGDGESYIAFYPEQVIILDDGKGNTEATSDTEVASFMPENEQGEDFESAEENNTPETQNPVSEEFEEDFEEENGSFFDEPSAEFPKPNLIEDIGAKAAGVTRHGEGQRIIIRIGKNLGYKVVFDPELKTKMGATSNGKFDFDNKIIYLNPAVSKPLQFIFGHEITHFGTASETFEEFIEPIRKTNLYLKWLQRKTGSDSSSVGLLEGLYRERVMESRKNADPMGAAEAQEEMYADFCGETFFSDGERGLTRLLNSLEGKKRSKVMQFIHDFVSYLKERLSGNKDITLQLIRLESKFADVLKSAKENTAENSGVKYSVSNDATYVKYCEKIENIENNDSIDNKGQFFKVSEQTPTIIVEKAKAKNLPVAIQFDTAYLETRHSGKLTGNYHNLGAENMKKLPQLLETPEYIVALPNGRLNIIVTLFTNKGNEAIVSIELEQSKQIDGKFDKYNLIITAFGAKKGYLEGIINNPKNKILYNKTTESQGTDQLHTWLDGINDSVSNNRIPQDDSTVKNKYMQKKEKHSISIDEGAENDTETDTDIGDIPSAMEELMQQYQNGDFGEDIFRARMDEIYNEALNRFGVIPEGEKAETPISVPQKISDDKITRRFVRTILETGKLTADMIADVEGEILLGDMMSYEEVSNETAMKRADRSFERGTAEADWQKVISGGVISETDIAIGEKLLLKAIEDNDRLKVLDLSSELSDIFTRSGRVVQAARMLKKMSGVGRLMTAQRNVNTINQSLAEKYGDSKDVPQVKLDPTLARQLAETQSMEDTEVVYQNILQDVAAQVPATVMDKLNAWRYFAMLANPRTHIRNLVSNTIFTPSVMIKNFVATGAEHLFVRDASKRTKAVFIKKEYLEFAKKDIKSREAKAMLEGKGQLDDKGMIQELRRTFDSDFLENLTKGNSNLLEKEDMWFKSVHYRNALAGFLQARKVDLNNVSEATLLQAREYAVKEAKKATFQDASVLADMLNNIKTPKKWKGNTKAEAAVMAARIGVEGVLPFKRTPINIVKRGIEYSPLGLAESLTLGLADVCKGKISVAEYCDGLAAGITGSALMAIGYFLASAGWAIGGFGDDDEDKFKQLNGEQEYSVQIFGKSYTIDWSAPACLPFFVGVELAEELSEGDGFQWRDLGEISWNTLEPITNLSMLSGVQGLIETVKYVDSSQTIGAMVADIGISFAMQLVPSVLGGISRTIDDTQRTWYKDKNSPLGNTAQTIKNNLQSKIPGLSFTQAPSIDAWGREKKRGSVGERIAENFISPGYYSKIDYDNADAELMRLAKVTGEGVFPKQAEKSFSIGGETKYLTADEWVTFAKAKGEYSFDYIHEFIESDSYEKLTDEQRVKVIDNLYEYAKAKAKTTVSEYDLMKGYKSVTNFERNGGSAVTYYVRRAILN